MQNGTENKDEGVRGFGPLLAALEEGSLHEDASVQLRDLNAKLMLHAEHYGKGVGLITLKIKLTASRGGSVDIDGDVTTKAPKAVRSRSVMWFTKGGNLSAKNPRQQELPLRDVSAPKTAEVGAEEKKPIRSV
jgi:hypothetical protein